MKKILYICFSVFILISMAACKPTEETSLKDYVDDVRITFSGDDTINFVTQDFSVTQSIEGIILQWTSSHPEIIAIDGKVNRPDIDTEVTLTATLQLGTAREIVNFIITVKAKEVVLDPLELALNNTNALDSYTMTMTFTSGSTSYPVIVKIDSHKASVEALGDTLYYEVVGDDCYIYELNGTIWSKSSITCSEKGTSELVFLTGFSKDYFVKQNIGGTDYYVLKMEYYAALESFLNSTATSNFKMTIADTYIQTIDLVMSRDSITFNVSISLSHYNQTLVTLPVISS